jgi:hypothetical protein
MFCTADLRINELAPGATLGMRAAWDGRVGGVAPAPAGPAVVKASFPFIGVADAVGKDVTDTRPISVVMDTTVVGVGAGAPAALSPALAIDAALADPQFATWVQAAPEVTWVNPNIVFQDGVWAIGLFKTAPDAQRPTRYGELTIDSTGQIVGRRFEP